MRNAMLLTLIGVIAVSLITIGVVYAMPQEEMPLNPTGSSVSEIISAEDTLAYPYLLRSYDGKLAVFTNNPAQPDMVFDVYVKTLPDFDQQQLARGVRVENYEKLTALIEDYIS